MTTWHTLAEPIRATAERELTPKQLAAWQLEIEGHGTRHISQQLNISRSSTLDRLQAAHRKLLAAGIRQTASGQWHTTEAA